ncbi:hypothetical protein [Subtercola endophyticus]|uniref:hypothetical protein n=1 Tax=Subtercola endophyticus TaxID=2895559 RepID=UPI001E3D65C6|nr:hypothetical protein [Subtercola endophyticus]UFS59087.1 hypothetical protein LQ955_19250 [Subtercola endophyticus]
MATRNPEWVAIFDNGLRGGDQVTTVSYLARTIHCQGLVTTLIPDRPHAVDGRSRFGAVQFQLFGPIRTHFLNYVRTISVVREVNGWRFDANGTIQEFEDIESYRKRKIVDRFTPEMLEEYSEALDLYPYRDDFYTGPSVLISNPADPGSHAAAAIIEAQRVFL